MTLDIHACEILTIEEMAERLRISRATLFVWLKMGFFTKGRHYFKRGRIVRFIWGVDTVNELLAEQESKAEQPVVRVPRQRKESALNWDY